jgi:hypothetical protein
MFPLAGSEFPTSTEQLKRAVTGVLAASLSSGNKNELVSAAGGTYPNIDKVRIELSGATVNLAKLPPRPKPAGERKPGVKVGELEVVGQPIRIENSAMYFRLFGRGLIFDYARDAQSRPLLVLANAQDGQIDLKIDKRDLQALLLSAATQAAKEQGVTIQDLKLELTSKGPRAVAVRADVKAKKMMMSGQITIRGRADLNDQLVATLSDLSCDGQGVVGIMAAAFLRERLKKLEGQAFSLMALSMGDVSLRDLQLKINGAVEVTARFGGLA